MKALFYIGLVLLALLEILKVYFIMPFPGSQESDTIDIAYFLHSNRWYLRILFGLMIIGGASKAFRIRGKWVPAVVSLLVIVIVYYFNFETMADRIFLEPETLTFKGKSENVLGDSTLVIAVEHEGEAKAYPVRFILYHHQVRDTVGSKPVMVTYCNVCRTGRVFEPIAEGQPEVFRLVGMDHFNAMFEDATTKSWWRQANGAAVAGPRAGARLPEVECIQVTASKFFNMYPFGEIMQADEVFTEYYDSLGKFEKGKGRSKLTGTDSLSWKDKSWVVGIEIGNDARAYDWNELKTLRIIHDKLGSTPIVLALSDDSQSFAAFRRNSESELFVLRNDSLIGQITRYDFSGRGGDGTKLDRLAAYQEFWHSWKTFRPRTSTYRFDRE